MKKISFSIFVFFSILLFCSLGTWQVYRLQWKLNLISEINNGLKSEPISFSKNNIKNYQKVKFTGTFNFEKQIYLYSLNNSGAPGYEVLTPLKTQFLWLCKLQPCPCDVFVNHDVDIINSFLYL